MSAKHPDHSGVCPPAAHPCADLSSGSSSPSTQAGLLLVVSGPSGVGKTTIVRHILQTLEAEFSVSVTTRQPGPNEVHGRDYLFISRPEFDALRDDGQLLEWAEVFGNCYGTPRKPVTEAVDAGRLIVLEIDVQGAIQVKRAMPEAKGLFILPPSEDALLERLRSRKREDEATIQRRFAEARREIAEAKASDAYDCFITNCDLAAAQQEAVAQVGQWLGHTGRAKAGSPDRSS